MNIVMMTNTYAPHTGGVARSVEWFSDSLRRQGHGVVVVAPTFADAPQEAEENIIRLPAIQNFNGSDFSVRLPIPGLLRATLDDFQPDVIHAHHPFLIGDTALRVAAIRDLPIIFTHHTMYERYTHYVPGDSPAMQRFAIRLATEFANLCDHVIAPSESIAAVLQERGVTTEITAIPTGIDEARFSRGDGKAARNRFDIPHDSFVVGHVGRLAPEKNLEFLARAVCRFLRSRPNSRFLVVGEGPSLEAVRLACMQCDVDDRLHYPGALTGRNLADAYHAMDVFAFASHSETQGMVLAEAMTAGVPVVAVDAPGAREVVRDRVNGRLLPGDDEEAFAVALTWCAERSPTEYHNLVEGALQTAKQFAMPRCAARLLSVYRHVVKARTRAQPRDDSEWSAVVRFLGEQWKIISGVASAVGEALLSDDRREDTV